MNVYNILYYTAKNTYYYGPKIVKVAVYLYLISSDSI